MKKYILLFLFIFIFPYISNADRFYEVTYENNRVFIDLDKVIIVEELKELKGGSIKIYFEDTSYGVHISSISYDCFVKLLKDKNLDYKDYKFCCCE